ncbi:MAG: transporter substrate-binding domain-containing protein [Rickettsiales bacterium]|jgi:ABC-type amino acid transport substrate-binding protein|nr:transporter substrate-binding domain-containing protein [Rickettsiales bacterium]
MKKVYFVLLLIIIVVGGYYIYLNTMQKKLLVIGIKQKEPFVYYDNKGKLTGFSIDILSEILKQDVIYKNVDDFALELEKKTIDIAITSGNKTKNASFSNSYFDNGFVLVKLSSNNNILKKQDVNNKKIGVIANIDDNYDLKNSLIKSTVLKYDIQNAFSALESGEIETIVLDKVTAVLKRPDVDKFSLVSHNTFLKNEFSFAINKKDTKLLKQINDGLHFIRQKGVYNKIVNKYFGE